MKRFELFAASAIALFYANPAIAQQVPPGQGQGAADQSIGDDIVVTAQRTSERLQDVPISVSAFTGKALETQQIHNSLDLQLSLPNITYTKTNFTASSFTIRGIGDLCTGFSCDAATGIHINDVPVPATRLFETEYLDMERVEVLRGPQGTLFGRNATSGVVNFITARPDLTGIHASGSAEYGNYNSKKVTGVFNLPIGDTIGVRVAGLYLKRDGYTTNTFDNSQIDGRDLYQVRGSIRWQPSSSTTVDLMGSYFRESDNRSRIQKQLCHRDPTGILGCQPDRLGFDSVNSNAVFQDILTSREFFGIALSPTLAPFGVRSLYGTDGFNGVAVPADLRTVNSNVNPTYFSDEINIQGRIDQDFGRISLSLIGGYSKSRVDSTAGYFLNTPNSLATNVGINTFLGAVAAPGSPVAGFATGRALAFNPAGQLCTSAVDRSYTGVFGGHTYGCSFSPLNYDESRSTSEGWSAEAHLNSHFDGMFNFLIGGIYLTGITNGDYYVSPGLGSYAAVVIGGAKGSAPPLSLPLGATYLAPGFFNSETDRYQLKSYGIFGETYFQFSPKWKLTIGARYSHDQKFVTDRSPLLSVLVPYGTANAFSSPFAAAYDADAGTPGNQMYRNAAVQFGRLTGRVVLDYKPSDNSMIYLSYSRGYKSGGINPPFDPSVFTAPATFKPESIDAFELGTKNTFMNGALRLNASVFYYKYKDLQLSRILNKTSFNDNTNADIYGAEVEAIVRPERHFMVNLSASYLKTKIKDFSLVDTRDPSGGRSDTVIIKDITNASNCVVRPTTAGNAVGANTLVTAFNGAIGLQGPTPVPGTNTTGAYSICSSLAAAIANPSAGLRALFGTPTGMLPFYVATNSAGTVTGLPDGVAVDLSGNQLPNAPTWKFSAGAQHTLDIGSNGMTLVTRGDLTYTGEYFSRSFNRPIDKIQGYEVVNLSVTLNGPEEKWYLRGFVQNLTGNNAITGQYVTDASTGLFTNVFTLEPRRYGVSAGFKF